MKLTAREHTIQDQIMAQRQRNGLRLAFVIPDRSDPFICYPATEAEKALWLITAEQRDWKVLS